jgi:hypothetical protein
MLRTVTNHALNTLANFRGWRTNRQLIVFESDDWGAIRVRDAATLQAMAKMGLRLPRSAHDHFDCLECRSDLDSLFNVLDANRSRRHAPPTFTFNTVMGNPDFQRIKEDNFSRFSHEGLFQSYLRYQGDDLRPSWERAIQASLIKPQFHAREHLNVDLWLNDLREGYPETRLAFDCDFYALTTNTSSSTQRHYLAAYWPESAAHLQKIKAIVVDGLSMFEREFGFRSRSFIACNYLLPEEVEAAIAAEGVELIQGKRASLTRTTAETGTALTGYTGFRNQYGQIYSARNVRFEPFQGGSRDWVASAMRQIGRAFSWGTPAIVSTHRVNYVGGLDPTNRDRNLKLLDLLLKKILTSWPDVEFITSDELLSCIIHKPASP